MSFNGNGTFNINTVGQPVITGTAISSTAFNTLTNDLANGLTNCVTRDGQSPPTGNIPMGGFRLTGLGTASNATDAISFGQEKSRTFVSVADYGASSSATGAANYTAIMAAIAANPGKTLVFPDTYYAVNDTIVVDSDKTKLFSLGTTIDYTGADGTDAVVFRCTSTATVTTFVNSNGIDGITIYSAIARTSGAGLRLTQCNLFQMGRVRVDNFFGGLLVEGGQLFGGDNFTTFMSAVLYPSVLSGSYQARFTSAPIDGGLYQPCFTFTLDKFISGGSYSAEFGLLIESADGLTFGGGYVAGPFQSLVRIKPNVSGKNVSGVDFGNLYLDGKNQSTGTENGIEILDDGFSGASLVNNIDFSSLLTVGNLQGKGIYSTHPLLQTISVDPTRIINCAGTEIDITGGDTSPDSWIGVPLSWAPSVTFTTPGDLAVTYSARLGSMLRTADGQVEISWSIATSAFTHTTASGNLQITGVPVGTPTPLLASRAVGTLALQGVTKAGYTQFSPYIAAGSSALEINASGSAVGLSTVAAADMPTAGTVILRGTLSFPASELG